MPAQTEYHVPSPMAAALLLADAYRRGTTGAWATIWGRVWEQLPRGSRRFLPPMSLPAIARGDGAASQPMWRQQMWDRRQNDAERRAARFVDLVMGGVLHDLRDTTAPPHRPAEAEQVWRSIADILQPHDIQNGWLWRYRLFQITCAPPALPARLDEENRLHAEGGPAIIYQDDWSVFAWHGVRVPEVVVMDPDAITAETIDAETNMEVRRVMIDRIGAERYVQLGGAVEVQRDKTGVLLRKQTIGMEPVVVVKVINSSPEPDGTFKTYWLRVPPWTQTAREGVAWTFGLSADEYLPEKET